MSEEGFFKSLTERLTSAANVKTVYGEPVICDGKTIIPVARIAYGFGGGSGKRTRENDPEGKGEEGGGGGGGVSASPVGVVEITQAGTRFIRFLDGKRLGAAMGTGFLLGVWFAKRGRRRSADS